MLPKTSTRVSAEDPSEEFPYTWICLKNGDTGMFFRTAEEAIAEANGNFHNFGPTMAHYEAAIVKYTDVLKHIPEEKQESPKKASKKSDGLNISKIYANVLHDIDCTTQDFMKYVAFIDSTPFEYFSYDDLVKANSILCFVAVKTPNWKLTRLALRKVNEYSRRVFNVSYNGLYCDTKNYRIVMNKLSPKEVKKLEDTLVDCQLLST